MKRHAKHSAKRKGPGRPMDKEASARRQEQILRAARLCFTREGFHAAGVADIAATAEVSVANLYQYFPAKDALILAITKQDLEADLELIDRLGGEPDFFSGLAKALESIIAESANADEYALRVEIFAEASRNARVRKALIQTEESLTGALAASIGRAQKSGHVRNDIAPEGLAGVIIRLVDGVYSGAGAGLVDAAALLPAVRALLETGLRSGKALPKKRKPRRGAKP